MTLDPATLIFQAINFLVLVAVLWRLIVRPLRKHMQERRERVENAFAELATKEERNEARAREIEQMDERARRAEVEAIARAERAAEERKRELLDETHRTLAQERERMRADMKREEERRREELLRGVEPVVAEALEHLLEELAGPASLHLGSCRRFASQLDSLTDPERHRMRAIADREGMELALARDELPEELGQAVQEILGKMPVTRLEPDLIAGACLRAGDEVYDGSAAAQIRRLLGAAR